MPCSQKHSIQVHEQDSLHSEFLGHQRASDLGIGTISQPCALKLLRFLQQCKRFGFARVDKALVHGLDWQGRRLGPEFARRTRIICQCVYMYMYRCMYTDVDVYPCISLSCRHDRRAEFLCLLSARGLFFNRRYSSEAISGMNRVKKLEQSAQGILIFVSCQSHCRMRPYQSKSQ